MAQLSHSEKICKTPLHSRPGRELRVRREIKKIAGTPQATLNSAFEPAPFFLLYSLTVRRAEIPQHFSSSSLPPSFAAGRCATAFIRQRGSATGRLAVPQVS